MQHNIPFSVGQRKSKLEKYCALFIFHLQMIHEKWKMKIGVAPLSHFPFSIIKWSGTIVAFSLFMLGSQFPFRHNHFL